MSPKKSIFLLSIVVLVFSVIAIGCSSPSSTSNPTTTSQIPTSTSKPISSTTSTTASSNMTQTSTPKYGGILRIADNNDGISIGYPPKMVRAVSNKIIAPCVETLLRFDSAANLIPWLATAIKEDSTNKTITLTLRQGVKFHDGTNFNASAVKWNFEEHIAAKSAATAKFKSIDTPDDYTIIINLTEWDSTVSSNLARTLGLMISPTACQKNGAEWAATNPVGTGPFKFVSWKKDVKTVYERFPDYWQKGKPYLDGIEWNVITENQTRLLSLQGKDLDIVYSLNVSSKADLEKSGFIINLGPLGSGSTTLVPNSANPNSPWSNLKVRQAAAYAIDTQTIVKSIYAGVYQSANQWIYPGHWAYNPSVQGYPYNVAKAKQLIAETEYSSGFKTKITYLSGQGTLWTAVRGYLLEIGIDCQLEELQPGAFDQIVYGGTWDGLAVGITTMNPDPITELSRWILIKAYNQMSLPDEYVQNVQKAVIASDLASKQKISQDLMQIMFDKYCMMIPIYTRTDMAVNQPYVKNHGVLSSADASFWTPEECWLDK